MIDSRAIRVSVRLSARSSDLVCLALERVRSSLLTKYKEAHMIIVIVLSLLYSEDNEDVKTMDRKTVEAVVLIRALFPAPTLP